MYNWSIHIRTVINITRQSNETLSQNQNKFSTNDHAHSLDYDSVSKRTQFTEAAKILFIQTMTT